MVKLSMRVKLSDPKPLQKKLVADELYAEGVERLVVGAARKAHHAARERAPGSLGSAITMAVERHRSGGGFGLLLGIVRVADRNRKGFRYPWALQSSKKVRYRHRSGSRQGRLTKAWFSGARSGLQKELKQGMADLSAAIQRKWSAGV